MVELTRRNVLVGSLGVFAAMGLAACTSGDTGSTSAATSGGTSGAAATPVSLTFDPAAWQYDATNNVYYQLGRTYAATPQAPAYETLGIYVPGAYLTGTKNADGSYTATTNASGKVGGFTASTAPIVMPVNTPGYAAQQPPTSYSYQEVSTYLSAGFIYVAAGMRGKDSQGSSFTGNAPWGVTDLKAAVRYLRFNADKLPGSTDRIFVFGMSGGGAQSTVMGASGDSALYTPYLSAIGAATTDPTGATLSDAVAGVMAWCPITNLDDANAAYEWNMGQFASTGTRAPGTWTAQYSKDLAAAFAARVNALGLTDSAGAKLRLDKSGSGVYLAGSYYDHLVSVVQGSLNDFLAVTTFPYTPSSVRGGMGGPPSGGAPPAGASGMPGGGAAPTGAGVGGQASSSSTTYDTVDSYVAHLNSAGTWVTYDAGTKKATVTSLAGFVTSQKAAAKDVGAFDGPARGQTENIVLGRGTSGLHFSTISRDVLKANESTYAGLSGWSSDDGYAAYESDFAKTDGVGKDVAWRSHMYDPMYYLAPTSAGYSTSKVAPHWRIRTGIMQGDTANTVEVGLALALGSLGLKDVDFATIWGQGHTQAELTGTASANFVTWVTKAVA